MLVDKVQNPEKIIFYKNSDINHDKLNMYNITSTVFNLQNHYSALQTALKPRYIDSYHCSLQSYIRHINRT